MHSYRAGLPALLCFLFHYEVGKRMVWWYFFRKMGKWVGGRMMDEGEEILTYWRINFAVANIHDCRAIVHAALM